MVSKGETGSSFEINDPGYSDRDTLTSYPNLLALNTFRPSQTDLSYMMFVADENIVLQLFDEFGNLVPTQNFLEGPIVEEGTTTENGETLSILLFSKPTNGSYTLSVGGGGGSYQLDVYLYDEEGNVIKQNFDGYIFENEKDQYPVSFNTQNNVVTTYKQILSDLENAYKNKLINYDKDYKKPKKNKKGLRNIYKLFGRKRLKSEKVYNSLKKQIEKFEKYYKKGEYSKAKVILYSVKTQTSWLTPWFIDSEVSLALISNLQALISSL